MSETRAKFRRHYAVNERIDAGITHRHQMKGEVDMRNVSPLEQPIEVGAQQIGVNLHRKPTDAEHDHHGTTHFDHFAFGFFDSCIAFGMSFARCLTLVQFPAETNVNDGQDDEWNQVDDRDRRQIVDGLQWSR